MGSPTKGARRMSKPETKKENIARFNRDVAEFGGYAYSATDRLSSRLANTRVSAAVDKAARRAGLKGKRVLDIGCGDGSYTLELLAYEPAFLLGIEPAPLAAERAQARAESLPNVAFRNLGIEGVETLAEPFDVAVLRGVLHHVPDVERGIDIVCRHVDWAIVVEPNGLNPVLKLLEKYSRYHIEHEERSFVPGRLDRMFEARGATRESAEFLSIVPYLCPDWIARVLGFFEPLVEALPLANRIGCGQTVKLFRTNRKPAR
jgi:SAM-dependent methyltransferase